MLYDGTKRRVSRAIILSRRLMPLHGEPVIFVESTGANRARPKQVRVREQNLQMHPAISRYGSGEVEMG